MEGSLKVRQWAIAEVSHVLFALFTVMLVLAMMELVAHDMHDPNNEASVKDGKERGKGRKNLRCDRTKS
jgi:hypothetical protein